MQDLSLCVTLYFFLIDVAVVLAVDSIFDQYNVLLTNAFFTFLILY